MKLIFGIGNPDSEYGGTRHNIGRAFARYADGHESDVYVNNSGLAVKKLNVKPENLIVAHDDLDIEFGKFKLSFDRNSGGHKGVDSIIKALKTKKFWRLRFGIANSKLKAARAKGKVPDFVLSKFTPTEQKQLKSIFKGAHDRINHA